MLATPCVYYFCSGSTSFAVDTRYIQELAQIKISDVHSSLKPHQRNSTFHPCNHINEIITLISSTLFMFKQCNNIISNVVSLSGFSDNMDEKYDNNMNQLRHNKNINSGGRRRVYDCRLF